MSGKMTEREGKMPDSSQDSPGPAFPETTRSLFDPIVQMANREMLQQTCRIYDDVIRDRAQQKSSIFFSADDLTDDL